MARSRVKELLNIYQEKQLVDVATWVEVFLTFATFAAVPLLTYFLVADAYQKAPYSLTSGVVLARNATPMNVTCKAPGGCVMFWDFEEEVRRERCTFSAECKQFFSGTVRAEAKGCYKTEDTSMVTGKFDETKGFMPCTFQGWAVICACPTVAPSEGITVVFHEQWKESGVDAHARSGSGVYRPTGPGAINEIPPPFVKGQVDDFYAKGYVGASVSAITVEAEQLKLNTDIFRQPLIYGGDGSDKGNELKRRIFTRTEYDLSAGTTIISPRIIDLTGWKGKCQKKSGDRAAPTEVGPAMINGKRCGSSSEGDYVNKFSAVSLSPTSLGPQGGHVEPFAYIPPFVNEFVKSGKMATPADVMGHLLSKVIDEQTALTTVALPRVGQFQNVSGLEQILKSPWFFSSKSKQLADFTRQNFVAASSTGRFEMIGKYFDILHEARLVRLKISPETGREHYEKLGESDHLPDIYLVCYFCIAAAKGKCMRPPAPAVILTCDFRCLSSVRGLLLLRPPTDGQISSRKCSGLLGDIG